MSNIYVSEISWNNRNHISFFSSVDHDITQKVARKSWQTHRIASMKLHLIVYASRRYRKGNLLFMSLSRPNLLEDHPSARKGWHEVITPESVWTLPNTFQTDTTQYAQKKIMKLCMMRCARTSCKILFNILELCN